MGRGALSSGEPARVFCPCSKSETDQHHFVTNGTTITIFLFLSVIQLYFSQFLNCIYCLNSQYLNISQSQFSYEISNQKQINTTLSPRKTIYNPNILISISFSIAVFFVSIFHSSSVSISHSLNSVKSGTDHHHFVTNRNHLQSQF